MDANVSVTRLKAGSLYIHFNNLHISQGYGDVTQISEQPFDDKLETAPT